MRPNPHFLAENGMKQVQKLLQSIGTGNEMLTYFKKSIKSF